MEDRAKKKKPKKIIKVVCLQDTSDSERLYKRCEVYELPEDHPCMKYFKPADQVADRRNPGPAPSPGMQVS